MGKVEGWSEPYGLLLNGLLPSAESVFSALDPERWLKAEERIAELIVCIQPNQPSEERRNAVADYVQQLIMKCFPCEVFTFGSVPLKTYLPDGDIDVTAFSSNQTLKDTWANQVRDMLENEEKNEQAEFRVKEVQYIQAEVKIIKCLVENIVVDISFNQLGGLCTLCFLEEVDNLINQNHLFKRSIILIKAWCYYESRILGAPHGLISTYALETLVLYIFHVFNNSFTGPLEVLYRFLEFFGNFDWDNFCVSLWGPVPINSLPDMTVEPPRKDGGDLLLSKLFLDACNAVYAVFLSGQEIHGQPFVSKHFNVIDPLRMNNNLGRSVSKGNFYRIRSAFTLGAKRLATLLECPEENIIYEVNQFFTSTWERHGSGQRPDAPRTETRNSKLSTSDHPSVSINSKKNRDVHGAPVVGLRNRYSMSQKNDLPETSKPETHTTHVNMNGARVSHAARESNSNNVGRVEGQKHTKSDHLNGRNGRFMFARTNSSPELVDTYSDLSTQARRHGHEPQESVQTRTISTKLDGNNRKKNQESDKFVATQFVRSSNNDSESLSGSNRHHDSGTDALNEEIASNMGTQGLDQEEQDLVNMMGSTSLHHFNGQIPFPFNSPSPHVPFPLPPSFLASLGYTQQNMSSLGPPSNVPSIDPSISNLHFPHGFVAQPLGHRFPGIGLNPNLEYSSEQSKENFSSIEVNSAGTENGFGRDQEHGFETENGSRDIFHEISPPWQSGSDTSMRVQQRRNIEKRGGSEREHLDDHQCQDNIGTKAYYEDRMTSSRFSSASYSNSQRSTTPENSSDGSSAKVSKSIREKSSKKAVAKALPKTVSEHEPDHVVNDDHVWNTQSNMGAEIVERNPSVDLLHAPQNLIPGYEIAQTSGSEPTMFVGSGSCSRENPDFLPFYPSGPPVPFITMLYGVPPESGASDTPSVQDDNDTSQNFDSPKHITNSGTTLDEQRSDILGSDFPSHYRNLQYGRFCQNPPTPGPMFYQTPVMIPPGYLQGGRILWDSSSSHGRPVPSNVNLLTQLMGYGSRVLPVSPISPVSNRPPIVYHQPFAGDMPKQRSGTGTYFPNPKISVRDRQPSNARRGNYNNYDRNDSYGDRDGNWNMNYKPRGGGAGRGYNRSQTEKSMSRLDRLSSKESRADRSWETTRNDSLPSFHSQNGPLRGGGGGGGGGLYSVPTVNHGGVSSHGYDGSSVLMVYPYEHDNTGSGSHAEQLEFGSLGPVGFGGSSDAPQTNDGSQPRGGQFDENRFHDTSGQRPSSPRHRRRN